MLATSVESLAIFQSTLPARGATERRVHHQRHDHISIHAPRTGSDGRRPPPGSVGAISIHAPRTGSDPVLSGRVPVLIYFNPRSPHGERPAARNLRASPGPDFNPRSPHGERRREGAGSPCEGLIFQSTLPARGATVRRDVPPPCVAISIHAPRTGSDLKETPWEGEKNAYFNPRSPHGERRSASPAALPTA